MSCPRKCTKKESTQEDVEQYVPEFYYQSGTYWCRNPCLCCTAHAPQIYILIKKCKKERERQGIDVKPANCTSNTI